MLLSIGDATV